MKPPKNDEFSQLMRGVQPLSPEQAKAASEQEMPLLSLPGEAPPVAAGKPQKFAGGGNAKPHRPLPKLGKHFHPDQVIDLHGMTLAQARETAEKALQRAQREGLLTLLLITGKGLSSPGGKGVIRQEMEDWLFHRKDDRIQQVRFAPRHLGGEGAILVIFA